MKECLERNKDKYAELFTERNYFKGQIVGFEGELLHLKEDARSDTYIDHRHIIAVKISEKAPRLT